MRMTKINAAISAILINYRKLYGNFFMHNNLSYRYFINLYETIMSFTAKDIQPILLTLETYLPKLKPASISFFINKKLISISDCMFYTELESKIINCRQYLTEVTRQSIAGELECRKTLTLKIEDIRAFINEGVKQNRCFPQLSSYQSAFERVYVRKLTEVNRRCDLLEDSLVGGKKQSQTLALELQRNQALIQALSSTYTQPNVTAVQATLFAQYAAESSSQKKSAGFGL